MELFVVIRESMQSKMRRIEGIYKHRVDAYELSANLNRAYCNKNWRFYVEVHYLRVDSFPII